MLGCETEDWLANPRRKFQLSGGARANFRPGISRNKRPIGSPTPWRLKKPDRARLLQLPRLALPSLTPRLRVGHLSRPCAAFALRPRRHITSARAGQSPCPRDIQRHGALQPNKPPTRALQFRCKKPSCRPLQRVVRWCPQDRTAPLHLSVQPEPIGRADLDRLPAVRRPFFARRSA